VALIMEAEILNSGALHPPAKGARNAMAILEQESRPSRRAGND
jgi:hypothetical protein